MNERALCCVWQAQRFSRGLFGTRGEAIGVVYRGRRQAGPGPDFQRAMLEIDGELRSGDVEVHVRASDWWVHGHHRDPRYSSVVLHVLLENDRPGSAQTVAGDEVATLDLGDYFDEAWERPDSGQASESGCQASCLSSSVLGSLLDRLGDERFALKAARYEAELSTADPEEVLYRGVLEALGYTRNRQGFRELARRLPAANLFSLAHRRPLAERLCLHQCLLLGVAGLLPSQRHDLGELDWPSAEYADELEAAWVASGYRGAFEVMDANAWQFGAVRPLNYPTRRLGAASRLLTERAQRGLIDQVVDSLLDGSAGGFGRQVWLFVVEDAESYWAGYYDFGRSLGRQSARLIGIERAGDIALNASLPFAVAYSALTDDSRLAEAAWSAYREAPKSADNEITRQMYTEALGANGRRLIGDARRQQALLHVFGNWCDRRACEDCPLGRSA